MEGFTIGKLARAGQVKIDTIRYYEQQGLLEPEGRTPSGYRVYGPETVRRLKFIKKAQHLGFTLSEIAKLLGFGTSLEASAGDVLAVTEEKIAEQKAKIDELKNLRRILHHLAEICPGEGPVSACPILDYLCPHDDLERGSGHE